MAHATFRWRQALWVGVPLGLIELGLVIAALLVTERLSPPRAVLLGAVLYLLVPAGTGFSLGLRQWRAVWEDALAGMRVGLVSGGVVTLGASVVLVGALVRNLMTRPPPGPHAFPRYSPTLDIVVTAVVWVLVAGFNAVGVGLSLLGGLGGTVLARWLRGAASRP